MASSGNATREGLTSAKIYVPEADTETFNAFKLALSVELSPIGQMQNQLFDVILHAAWNIRRCIELEADVQNEAIRRGLPDAILDDEMSRKLDRLYRYKKCTKVRSARQPPNFEGSRPKPSGASKCLLQTPMAATRRKSRRSRS